VYIYFKKVLNSAMNKFPFNSEQVKRIKELLVEVFQELNITANVPQGVPLETKQFQKSGKK